MAQDAGSVVRSSVMTGTGGVVVWLLVVNQINVYYYLLGPYLNEINFNIFLFIFTAHCLAIYIYIH